MPTLDDFDGIGCDRLIVETLAASSVGDCDAYMHAEVFYAPLNLFKLRHIPHQIIWIVPLINVIVSRRCEYSFLRMQMLHQVPQ